MFIRVYKSTFKSSLGFVHNLCIWIVVIYFLYSGDFVLVQKRVRLNLTSNLSNSVLLRFGLAMR